KARATGNPLKIRGIRRGEFNIVRRTTVLGSSHNSLGPNRKAPGFPGARRGCRLAGRAEMAHVDRDARGGFGRELGEDLFLAREELAVVLADGEGGQVDRRGPQVADPEMVAAEAGLSLGVDQEGEDGGSEEE